MTIEYTILEPGTARVLETGTAPDFNGLALRGQVMAGLAPAIGDCWHDGEQFRRVPPQPGPHHDWCWQAHEWLDLWAPIRAQRAPLLAESDAVARAAEKAGEPVPQPWRVYRQALRDITQQPDPRAVQWPVRPQE